MRAIGVLACAFRDKELELKGINMDRPEGGEIKLTLVDYLPRYQEAEEERKRFEEHVAALGAPLRWGYEFGFGHRRRGFGWWWTCSLT